MITNYLIELIKDNECVIVPNFGAFISKRHSAAIDYANHRFTPPYKEIVFNNQLNNDDSVLIDFISQKEKISKEEASEKIQSFVNRIAAILDVNSEYTFENFGKIRKFGDNLVFKANDNINLLGDSFGLTDFNYQPIFRTETYQIIKEKIIVEQKEKNTEYTIAIDSVKTIESEESSDLSVKRKPSLLKTVTLTLSAFLLLLAINWGTYKNDSNLASWNPFFYSSPNEFLINNLESENLGNSESENLENLESENLGNSESENLGNSESENIENLESKDIENIELHHYFIVGGSFQTIESADKCLNSIKKQGFENASLLDKNDKGYIRVYYESFAEKSDALIRLEVIKSDINESAWLLFQK